MAIPATASSLDFMVAPIPDGPPSGGSIPEELETAIIEAKRFDDGGGGVWERQRVEANWELVRDLTRDVLAHHSKHLKLAVWYTESATHIDGLPGLAEGFRLIAALIETFWSRGLKPLSDEADNSWRATVIEGLNAVLPSILTALPLTDRKDGGRNYALFEQEQSVQTGLEKNLRDADGNINVDKSKKRKELIESGALAGEFWKLLSLIRTVPFTNSLLRTLQPPQLS